MLQRAHESQSHNGKRFPVYSTPTPNSQAEYTKYELKCSRKLNGIGHAIGGHACLLASRAQVLLVCSMTLKNSLIKLC